MTYVISFQDYTPSPRYDGVSWTSATIEEASTQVGPWTLIDTVPLDPIDPDPAAPEPRSFTTSQAALSSGYYRLTFTDSLGGQDESMISFHSVAPPPVLATVDDVIRVLRLGSVDDETRVSLQASLDAAISRVHDIPIRPYDSFGGTAKYFSIGNKRSIQLPVPDCTVTAVRGYLTRSLVPFEYDFFPINYELTDRRLYLWGDPFMGELVYTWDRVEVDWTWTGVVPAGLRDGVAAYAGWMYQQMPSLSTGIRSERIGTYQYTRMQLDQQAVKHGMPDHIYELVRPYKRPREISVVP